MILISLHWKGKRLVSHQSLGVGPVAGKKKCDWSSRDSLQFVPEWRTTSATDPGPADCSQHNIRTVKRDLMQNGVCTGLCQQRSHTAPMWLLTALHPGLTAPPASCPSSVWLRPSVSWLEASGALECQRANHAALPLVNRAPILNALSVTCALLLLIDVWGCRGERGRGGRRRN